MEPAEITKSDLDDFNQSLRSCPFCKWTFDKFNEWRTKHDLVTAQWADFKPVLVWVDELEYWEIWCQNCDARTNFGLSEIDETVDAYNDTNN